MKRKLEPRSRRVLKQASKRAVDRYSYLGLYGDYSVFSKRVNEGYTQIAFGSGPWCEDLDGGLFLDCRVVGIWVFFHPDGRIATLESWKGRRHDMKSVRRQPWEDFYTRQGLVSFLKKWKITLSDKSSLPSLLRKWNGKVKYF